MAAPAYRASNEAGATTGGSPSVTLVVATGDHLVVQYNANGNTNASPTCTDDHSGTYALIGTALWSSSANIGGVFVRNQAVPSGDNGATYTITVTTGTNTARTCVVIATSGMNVFGAASIRSSGFQANQANGSTPAPALNQSALTGNPTIGGVFSIANGHTPPASWTERKDVFRFSGP